MTTTEQSLKEAREHATQAVNAGINAAKQKGKEAREVAERQYRHIAGTARESTDRFAAEMKKMISSSQEAIGHGVEVGKERGRELVFASRRNVRRHPLAAVATAGGVGFVAGLGAALLARRRWSAARQEKTARADQDRGSSAEG